MFTTKEYFTVQSLLRTYALQHHIETCRKNLANGPNIYEKLTGRVENTQTRPSSSTSEGIGGKMGIKVFLGGRYRGTMTQC